jgi:hypothetical protein
MSRDCFNNPANPAMAEWSLQADNLYAGVMLVDFASPMYRLALSGNFEHYTPVTDLAELAADAPFFAARSNPRLLNLCGARPKAISSTRGRVSW